MRLILMILACWLRNSLPDDPCNYEGLDGLVRNVAKLQCEKIMWDNHMADPIAEWRDKWWSLHEMTNLWVEGCRGSPYYFGHVLMVWSVLNGAALASAIVIASL